MPPSGVDYASEFLNGYAPEYVSMMKRKAKSQRLVYASGTHRYLSLMVLHSRPLKTIFEREVCKIELPVQI